MQKKKNRHKQSFRIRTRMSFLFHQKSKVSIQRPIHVAVQVGMSCCLMCVCVCIVWQNESGCQDCQHRTHHCSRGSIHSNRSREHRTRKRTNATKACHTGIKRNNIIYRQTNRHFVVTATTTPGQRPVCPFRLPKRGRRLPETPARD